MVSATHPLRFGNFVLRHNMIVGNLDGCEGILGVDVLNNRKGVLNLGGGYLNLSGHIIPLDHSHLLFLHRFVGTRLNPTRVLAINC